MNDERLETVGLEQLWQGNGTIINKHLQINYIYNVNKYP